MRRKAFDFDYDIGHNADIFAAVHVLELDVVAIAERGDGKLLSLSGEALLAGAMGAHFGVSARLRRIGTRLPIRSKTAMVKSTHSPKYK